tara:strand:- start:8606 stop:10354 length:1749 start_codon:yes stop_codon:yes gene_type:complete
MNLISQIAKLPHLSDEQLKTYISDKGNPLSPFALATLQSKAIARKKFGAPEAPKQTVAEQVEAEASAPLGAGIAGLQPQGAPAQMPPPQGASMPPPPMPMQQPPMPQGMAGGGMVAFDEGGVASLPLRDDMFNEDNYAKGGIVGYAGPEGSLVRDVARVTPFGPLMNVGQDITEMAGSPAAGDIAGIVRGANESIDDYLRRASDITGIPLSILSSTPAEALSRNKPQAQTQGTAQPGNIPNSDFAARQKEYFKNYKGSYAPPAAAGTPKVDPAKSVNPMKELLAAQASSASPYTIDKAVIEKIKSPAAFDRTAYNQERRQAMIDANVDPEFYDKQTAKNETQREALKSDREQAKWMAGLQTGFGIMGGTSQNPFENISKGATAGLAQYGADIKDIKSEERVLRAADDKLAEAQYLQGRGDAEGALKAMKDRETLIASVDAMNVQAANVNETAFTGDKNKMRGDVFKNEQENRRLAIAQAGETERSQNQIAATERATKATQDLNLTYKQQESYNKAVKNTEDSLTLQYGAGFGATLPTGDFNKIYQEELRKQQLNLGLKPIISELSISGLPEGAAYRGSRPAT